MDGAKGTTGATGLGVTGVTGFPGGSSFAYTYDDSSNADADPGSGKFRLNNSITSSATQIYVDDLEALFGADISAVSAASMLRPFPSAIHVTDSLT